MVSQAWVASDSIASLDIFYDARNNVGNLRGMHSNLEV